MTISNLLANNGSLHAVPEIPAGETDVEAEASSRDQPLLGHDVPVAEVAAHQLEADSLGLARLEVDLLETSELADGSALGSSGREGDVELGNGGTGNVAGVGDGGVDGVDGLPESGVATGGDGQILGLGGDGVDGRGTADAGGVEGGVGETETELVADGNVLGVEVAVVDVQLLVEPGLPVIDAGGVDSGGGGSVVVGSVEGNGVREVTRGVDLAVEDVNDRVTGLLTGEVGSDNGSDVRVVGEGQKVDSRGVGDNDGVVAGSSDAGDNLVTVPVDVERLAVGSLLGPCLQEHKADLRLLGDPERSDVGVGKKSVVQPVLDESAILRGLVLNGNKRGDKVSGTTGTRSTASNEGAELVVLLVDEALGRLTCIVTEDSDRLGCLEGKNVVLVLEEDSSGSAVLADVLTVVLADVPGGGTGKVPVALPSVDRREGVQPSSGRVNGREVDVLTEPVVWSHLADDHVVDSGFRDSAVVHHRGDVAAEVRTDTVGGSVVTETTGHVHVKTTLDGGNTGVDRTPIGHNVALKSELGLQDSVLGLGVLASIRAVESLVGAHERGSTGLDRIGEGPKVKLVQGSVVHVGRKGLLNDSVEGGVRVVGRVALSFLVDLSVVSFVCSMGGGGLFSLAHYR